MPGVATLGSSLDFLAKYSCLKGKKMQLMFLKKRAGKYTKAPSEVYTKVNQPKSVEKKKFGSDKYI
jgi:hypothetical protein